LIQDAIDAIFYIRFAVQNNCDNRYLQLKESLYIQHQKALAPDPKVFFAFFFSAAFVKLNDRRLMAMSGLYAIVIHLPFSGPDFLF